MTLPVSISTVFATESNAVVQGYTDRPIEPLIKGSDRAVSHWPASGYLVHDYRRAGQRKRSARAGAG
jgi:hypothetical protein